MLSNGKLREANLRTDYAQRSHFCEVFEDEMEALYLLAFLLTANHQDAEKCFVSTVDECFKQTGIFVDWTSSWVKRSLIRTAIQITRPISSPVTVKSDFWSLAPNLETRESEIDGVTRLAPTERFVFVMTVLEHYSVWDCALFLGVSTKNVASAQLRALRRLPNPTTFFATVPASEPHGMQVTA